MIDDEPLTEYELSWLPFIEAMATEIELGTSHYEIARRTVRALNVRVMELVADSLRNATIEPDGSLSAAPPKPPPPPRSN